MRLLHPASCPAHRSLRGGSLAMMIPDVRWYESDAIGWAGSVPDPVEGGGHGLIEQVLVDGMSNAVAWFGLIVSLRASLPLLNGFIFPKAPEAITDKLWPFIMVTTNKYMSVFQRWFPYNINGVDLAVFPAFVGVLFLMSATEAIGKTPPGKTPLRNAKPKFALPSFQEATTGVEFGGKDKDSRARGKDPFASLPWRR